VPAGATFVQADVRSPAARELLARGGFTLLNHHAAQMDVRRSVADPLFRCDVNVLGFLNLLEGARLGHVRRVVFASSGGTVYGESARLPVAESAPKLPASPYGTAKLASEYYLATFSQLYGLETVALRYSNVYGPRQNPHGEAGVVAIFAHRVLAGQPLTVFGDGAQTRDMVFVQDVVRRTWPRAVSRSRRWTDRRARLQHRYGVETSVNDLAPRSSPSRVADWRSSTRRSAPASCGGTRWPSTRQRTDSGGAARSAWRRVCERTLQSFKEG